jgi:hypothetical protein
VVEAFAALEGGLDGDVEIAADGELADVVVEGLGPEADFARALLARGARVFHGKNILGRIFSGRRILRGIAAGLALHGVVVSSFARHGHHPAVR